MEHKIKIDDNMSDKRRENAYRNIKAVLLKVFLWVGHKVEYNRIIFSWDIDDKS